MVGTATHCAMQYLNYANCVDSQAIAREVEALVARGNLTQEQSEMINCDEIAAFFASDFGKKLRQHPQVLREFKFSILEDATAYDVSLQEEEILLQGVVDCAMVDDDGIIILDFKTDYVTEDTLDERVSYYRPQIMAYASAMERIYKRPVKEAMLYFFRLNRFVRI